MAWAVGITLVVMLIFAWIAATGEQEGNPFKLTVGQAIVEYGWIALAVCGLIVLARGCG